MRAKSGWSLRALWLETSKVSLLRRRAAVSRILWWGVRGKDVGDGDWDTWQLGFGEDF